MGAGENKKVCCKAATAPKIGTPHNWRNKCVPFELTLRMLFLSTSMGNMIIREKPKCIFHETKFQDRNFPDCFKTLVARASGLHQHLLEPDAGPDGCIRKYQ